MSILSSRGWTLAALAQRQPHVVDWGIRLDRAPAGAWLALQAVALAPTGFWMASQWQGSADVPLGLLALTALVLLAWAARREWRASPRLGWLLLGMAGTLAVTVMRAGLGGLPALPPVLAGAVAVSAMGCSVMAFLPRRIALAPVIGLLLLAFPMLPALQAVLGVPLPMPLIWLGVFTACTVSLRLRLSGRAFAMRLPLAGLLLLLGAVLDDPLRAAGQLLPDRLQFVRLAAVSALTCGAIAAAMVARRRHLFHRPSGERHGAHRV